MYPCLTPRAELDGVVALSAPAIASLSSSTTSISRPTLSVTPSSVEQEVAAGWLEKASIEQHGFPDGSPGYHSGVWI